MHIKGSTKQQSDYNNLLDIRSDQIHTCDAFHSLGQNAKKGDIREDVGSSKSWVNPILLMSSTYWAPTSSSAQPFKPPSPWIARP